MKLISIEQTTLLKFLTPSRSAGQLYLPDVAAALTQRFNFIKHSEIKSERLEELEFLHGLDSDFAIGKLGIYNDGVVVRSQSNSAKIEVFFSTFMHFMKDTFDLDFQPTTMAGSIFESNLVVQLDKDVMKVFKKLSRTERLIAEKLLSKSNINSNCEIDGFSISVEPIDFQRFKPAQFKLERRAGADPAINHYFSVAPLATSDHLDLLSDIEKIV